MFYPYTKFQAPKLRALVSLSITNLNCHQVRIINGIYKLKIWGGV
jgi:hypothetical protein